MTIVLHTHGSAAWQRAVELHRKGDPGELVRLLAAGGRVPVAARAYLASLVKDSARRAPGRPVKTVGEHLRDREIAERHKIELAIATFEDKTGAKVKGTAKERAMLRTMAAFGVSRATVKRAVAFWG